ncbi:MAG TPA: hypothetical protein DCL66_13025 [Gammaproteobacteria bacterium]|jgi:hypothetical protein|nr:hypothetical protein [Gammaproteobacteria bacterium]
MSGGAINIIRLVIDLYATVHSNSNRLDWPMLYMMTGEKEVHSCNLVDGAIRPRTCDIRFIRKME